MPHKDPERRREYARRYYRSRPEYQKVVRARAHAWTKAHRIRLLEAIVQYLREHPCSDCGEDDPVVLCFDHVVGDKEFHIADAARTGYSLKRVMAEIAKCEVRCANCHLRRHNLLNKNGLPLAFP